MFDTKLFGYDKEQVDGEIDLLSSKIQKQQHDLDYLRNENKRLKNKAKSKVTEESQR